MTPLRDYPSAWIQVFGYEYLGSTTHELQTDIFWTAPGTRNLVEMVAQRDRVFTQRAVGDGVTLWNYNPARNEYSASIYGTYSTPQPQNYKSNLLGSLTHALKGTSAYAGRLLNEVYGGDAAVYRAWVPQAGEPTVYENGAQYTHPINNQRYTSIPAQRDYIVYQLGNPVRRVVMFERVYGPLPGNYDGWRISKVYVAEVVNLGQNQRTIDIAVNFWGNSVPTTASFAFQPPAGAKSIAGPRPVGG